MNNWSCGNGITSNRSPVGYGLGLFRLIRGKPHSRILERKCGGSFLFAPARNYILSFGWICCFLVTATSFFGTSTHSMWIICWCGIGLISLHFHTKPERRYFSPLFMTLFYFSGYLLAFIYVVLQKNAFRANERYPYLLLESFRNGDMLVFTSIFASGIAGFICTSFIAELLFKTEIGGERDVSISDWNAGASLRNMNTIIWLWLFGSLSLMLCMWILGIGRGGLVNKTVLPFKLAGIMVYSRNFMIPFVGIILLEISLYNERKNVIRQMVFFLFLVGLVGSVTAMSRSYFFCTILPPLAYLILKFDWKRQSRKILVLALSCLVVAIVMVTVVKSLRDVGYTGERVSIGTLRTDDSALNIKEGATDLISLAVTRVVGFQELLRVYDAAINDIHAPIEVFLGRNKQYLDFLLLQVTGRTFESDGITSFGYGFGLWGTWFMSRSYLLVFLASFIFSFLIILVEEVFLRRDAQVCALYLSFTLSMWTWGGIYLFFLKRAVFMVIACYFIMLELQRRSYACSRTNYSLCRPKYG